MTVELQRPYLASYCLIQVTERAMDSNDLERERGITILAKAASVQWKDTRINIVDTPGHADFGGEVERILNMVDGALVLVDAAEGPLPQTKFVVSKALKVGLKPIVVINKVDRPDARATEVINEVFDLFAALNASEEQLDFPILYGSAKQGWMAESPDGSHEAGMQPLFDLIVRHVAPPTVEEGPFRMIGTILEANPYLGRIITGRISSGSIKPNQAVTGSSRAPAPRPPTCSRRDARNKSGSEVGSACPRRRCCLRFRIPKINMPESPRRQNRATMGFSRWGPSCSTRKPPRFCARSWTKSAKAFRTVRSECEPTSHRKS